MRGVEYSLELLQQVGGVLVYFWPSTVLLAAAWVWAFVATKRTPNGGRWRTFALGCLPPFAFPVVIWCCGVLFASGPDGGGGPAFVGFLIWVLVLVQLPLAGVACQWWGERWPAILASWLCAWYVSLAAGLMSLQSVTGVWL